MPTSVAIIVMVLAIAGAALILTEPRRRSRKLAGALFEAVGQALGAGQYGRVLEVGALALEGFKKGSEPWLLTHWMMGQAAVMLADTTSAEHHLRTVRSALDAEMTGGPLDVEPGRLDWWLGHVALLQEQHDEAAHLFQRSLAAGDDGGRAHTLRVLGQVEASRERFDVAHRLLRESREHSAGPLDDHGYHAALGGDVLLPQGRIDEALDHLDRAEQGYLELGEVIDAGRVRAHRGQAALERGDSDEAVRLLREALGFVTTRSDNAAGELFVLPRLAMAEIGTGDLTEAGRRIERADQLNDVVRSPETGARIRWAAGRLAAAKGHDAEARDQLARAIREFDAVEKPSVARVVDADLQGLPG